MSAEFFEKLNELNRLEVSFAVATVIKITGSVSAKPGAKSIINAQGETVFGWVGGGCAESAVREAALECLKDRQTCIVPLDLDDEVLGVGMPCGGTMEVYVEPFLPRPELLIVGHGRIAEVLADPASGADPNGDGTASTTQDEFVELVNVTAVAIDIGGLTLSDATGLRHTFPPGTWVPSRNVI